MKKRETEKCRLEFETIKMWIKPHQSIWPYLVVNGGAPQMGAASFFVVRCEVSHIFEDEDGYVEKKNIPDPNDRKTNQTESFFLLRFVCRIDNKKNCWSEW